MFESFGDMDVEDLLKILLVLVIVWFALEILDFALDILVGPLQPIVGLAVLLLLVLWFVDAI